MNSDSSEWRTGPQAWEAFTQQHPELGYRPGRWPFHNFLRIFKGPLLAADAIRIARGRHWVAHGERFARVAFDCATGVVSRSESTPTAASRP